MLRVFDLDAQVDLVSRPLFGEIRSVLEEAGLPTDADSSIQIEGKLIRITRSTDFGLDEGVQTRSVACFGIAIQ